MYAGLMRPPWGYLGIWSGTVILLVVTVEVARCQLLEEVGGAILDSLGFGGGVEGGADVELGGDLEIGGGLGGDVELGGGIGLGGGLDLEGGGGLGLEGGLGGGLGLEGGGGIGLGGEVGGGLGLEGGGGLGFGGEAGGGLGGFLEGGGGAGFEAGGGGGLGGLLDAFGGGSFEAGGEVEGGGGFDLGGFDMGGGGGFEFDWGTGGTTTAEGGGCNCGETKSKSGKAQKKVLIKKGKRKIKKKRGWQSSFSSQSVGPTTVVGGGKKVVKSGAQGQKVKIKKKPTGWQGNRLASHHETAEKPLLQKRWSSSAQASTQPVGLKSVGVASKLSGTQPMPKPSQKTATSTVGGTHHKIASTRFQASAKTATTKAVASPASTKLNLGLTNGMTGNGKKYGAKTSGKFLMITTPNPKRSTLPPLKKGRRRKRSMNLKLIPPQQI